jgi:hypothetical protein
MNNETNASPGRPDDTRITINVWERSEHHDIITYMVFSANGVIYFDQNEFGSAFGDFEDCCSFDDTVRFTVNASDRMRLFSHFLGETVPESEANRRDALVEILATRLKSNGIKNLLIEAGLACPPEKISTPKSTENPFSGFVFAQDEYHRDYVRFKGTGVPPPCFILKTETFSSDDTGTLGFYPTLEAAQKDAFTMVIEQLKALYRPGMSADDLYNAYFASRGVIWIDAFDKHPIENNAYGKKTIKLRAADIIANPPAADSKARP